MTDKTITITIVGEESLIDASVDSFARRHGWTDTIEDENGDPIPNPVTQLAVAELAVKQFIGDEVRLYNAAVAAEAARTEAIAATEAGLDAVTLTASES